MSLLHCHEYIDCHSPAMWPPGHVNAFNSRNPNLFSLFRLTMDKYIRTNIPSSHQTVYSPRRPIEYIPCTSPRVPLLHRLQYCNIIFAIWHIDRPSAAFILVSTSQYCSLADVLLSTKSDRVTVLILSTTILELLNHVHYVIRRQNVHNRWLSFSHRTD